MNNALEVFDFEDHAVRVIDQDGEPWFVGKDVCRCLEISDHHQALDRLDDDEGGRYNVPTPSGTQEMKIVSEPGVYQLIFTSRTEAAKRFKRWLAHEVLPSLRRQGHYTMAPDRGAAAEPLGPDDLDLRRQWVSEINLCLRVMGRRQARRLWRASPLGQPDDAARELSVLPDAAQQVVRFLDDCTLRRAGALVSTSVLFCAFEDWCAARGSPLIAQTQFGKALAALGYEKVRGTEADGARPWMYAGLALG